MKEGLSYKKEANSKNLPNKIKQIESILQNNNKQMQVKNDSSKLKGIDAAVQTDLELIDLSIQIYQLNRKAHLYTENIDLIEQIEMEQPLVKQKKRINNEKPKEKNQINVVEKIFQDPFVIKYKQGRQSIQKQKPKLQDKHVIALNQNQGRQSIQKQKPKLQDKNVIVLNQNQLINKSLRQTKISSSKIEINLSKCVCQGQISQEDYYKCELCSNSFHYSCHRRQQSNNTTEVCPFCILREIEINQQIEEILCEQYLQFDKGTTLFKGEFNFKPYEYYCSMKLRNHQLEMRCLQVSGNQQTMTEVTWPYNCKFYLDGRKIFEVIQFKKRKDFPLKFSQAIYQQQRKIDVQKVEIELRLNRANIIQIDENFEINKPIYLFGIYFTRVTSFSAVTTKMLARLKTSSTQYMHNLINDRTHQDLQINKLTYSLLDPYSWNIMRLPVRGIHCRHAQCFDMGTYLSLIFADRTRYLKCPLCMKSTLILSKDYQQQAILYRIRKSDRIPKEVFYLKSGMIEVNLYGQEKDSEQQGKKMARITKGKKTGRKYTKQDIRIDVVKQQQKSS